MGLREFLSRIFFRHKKQKVVILDNNPVSIACYLEKHGDKILDKSDKVQRFPNRPILVKRPGSQAAHQNIEKFMQHGHQLFDYRKTVKQHVDPEED